MSLNKYLPNTTRNYRCILNFLICIPLLLLPSVVEKRPKIGEILIFVCIICTLEEIVFRMWFFKYFPFTTGYKVLSGLASGVIYAVVYKDGYFTLVFFNTIQTFLYEYLNIAQLSAFKISLVFAGLLLDVR